MMQFIALQVVTSKAVKGNDIQGTYDFQDICFYESANVALSARLSLCVKRNL